MWTERLLKGLPRESEFNTLPRTHVEKSSMVVHAYKPSMEETETVPWGLLTC